MAPTDEANAAFERFLGRIVELKAAVNASDRLRREVDTIVSLLRQHDGAAPGEGLKNVLLGDQMSDNAERIAGYFEAEADRQTVISAYEDRYYDEITEGDTELQAYALIEGYGYDALLEHLTTPSQGMRP